MGAKFDINTIPQGEKIQELLADLRMVEETVSDVDAQREENIDALLSNEQRVAIAAINQEAEGQLRILKQTIREVTEEIRAIMCARPVGTVDAGELGSIQNYMHHSWDTKGLVAWAKGAQLLDEVLEYRGEKRVIKVMRPRK